MDILFNDNRGYYLYSKDDNSNIEYFLTISALVEWYSKPKKDFPFKLVDGMPIYDNLHLRFGSSKHNSEYVVVNNKRKNDANAPELPLKRRNIRQSDV